MKIHEPVLKPLKEGSFLRHHVYPEELCFPSAEHLSIDVIHAALCYKNTSRQPLSGSRNIGHACPSVVTLSMKAFQKKRQRRNEKLDRVVMMGVWFFIEACRVYT